MVQAEGLVAGRRVRRWRSVAEKRRIVELTWEPGASVALVARAHGVNANQVFKWRRAFERSEMSEPTATSVAYFRLWGLLHERLRFGRQMLEYAMGGGRRRVLEADSRAAHTTETAFRANRISKVCTCGIQGIVSCRGWSVFTFECSGQSRFLFRHAPSTLPPHGTRVSVLRHE
jgi:transposase-like protein